MSETSDSSNLFLKALELENAKNLKDARRKLELRFAGTAPNTVQDFADKNEISYNQALEILQGNPQQIGEGKNAYFTFPDSKLGTIIPMEDTKLEKFFRKYDPTYDSYAGKVDKELEVVDGKVVGKNRPKGAGRFFAGLGDILTFGLSDFDRQGGGIGGMATGLGYDVKDYNINLSKKGKELLEQQSVEKELDKLDIDPTGLGGEGTTADRVEKLLQKQKDFERKNRRRDSIEAFAGQAVQIPIVTRLLEDAAKRRLELDKAMLGAREMMPSNIQNIMLSKQAQQQMASSAFAEEAKALAAQQDAATNFAGLGMQRKFG